MSCDRDRLLKRLSDLDAMNAIYDKQAANLQYRKGDWCKYLSDEEIDKKIDEYTQMIKNNLSEMDIIKKELFKK